MKKNTLTAAACLSLLLQVSTSLTPAIAATTASRMLTAPQDISTLPVRPYILAPGETVNGIAKSVNLTPEQLRKLNQLRTFAHGFENLQAGDELDIPVRPLPEIIWADEPAQQPLAISQEKGLAQMASQTGAALASDSAASMVSGIAAGKISEQLQQWLSQFGTVQVRLGTGENLDLQDYQTDLLIPLYEQENLLFFTQESFHRTDDRTQANLGTGLRWFNEDAMLGGNLFIDRDFSHGHTRAGAGVEYWRNYLKFGANQYLRLTNWKNSPDLTDYNERPADGWDIRVQGWLPAYPQLGAGLTLEQYYGNEVGLSGRDTREKNPRHFTAALEWTPVPLLTFGAERRLGQNGDHDARFSLNFHWQPSIPLNHQLTPEAVGGMRTLVGSRYDLVERNNNIVLEYRKQEVIRLHTVEHITGFTGEQKSLEVSVDSKYALSGIEWTAPALLAAGGKIIRNGATDYSVLLPGWREGTREQNTYIISGVARDLKGNRSERSETQVSVQAPVINEDTSTFTVSPSTILADDSETTTLTLTAQYTDGVPLKGLADELAFTVKNHEGGVPASEKVTVSRITESAPGVYIAKMKGSQAGVWTVTPHIGGLPVGRLSGAVTLTADTTSYGLTLRTDVNNSLADSATQNKLTAILKDKWGNPAPAGTEVRWTVDGTARLAATTNWTDANGEATMTLTDDEWVNNGLSRVTATASGQSETQETVFRPLYTFEALPATQPGYASDAGNCETLVRGSSCVGVSYRLTNNKTGQPETVIRPAYILDNQGSVQVVSDKDKTITLNQTKAGTHKIGFTLDGVKSVEWKNTESTYVIMARTESEMVVSSKNISKGRWWLDNGNFVYSAGYANFIIEDKFSNPVQGLYATYQKTNISSNPYVYVVKAPSATDNNGKLAYKIGPLGSISASGPVTGRIEISFSDDLGGGYSDFLEGDFLKQE